MFFKYWNLLLKFILILFLGACPSGQSCTLVKSGAGGPECLCYGCTGNALFQRGFCTSLKPPYSSIKCGSTSNCRIGMTFPGGSIAGNKICLGNCPIFGTRPDADRRGNCGCLYTSCDSVIPFQ